MPPCGEKKIFSSFFQCDFEEIIIYDWLSFNHYEGDKIKKDDDNRFKNVVFEFFWFKIGSKFSCRVLEIFQISKKIALRSKFNFSMFSMSTCSFDMIRNRIEGPET